MTCSVVPRCPVGQRCYVTTIDCDLHYALDILSACKTHFLSWYHYLVIIFLIRHIYFIVLLQIFYIYKVKKDCVNIDWMLKNMHASFGKIKLRTPTQSSMYSGASLIRIIQLFRHNWFGTKFHIINLIIIFLSVNSDKQIDSQLGNEAVHCKPFLALFSGI